LVVDEAAAYVIPRGNHKSKGVSEFVSTQLNKGVLYFNYQSLGLQ